MAMSRPFVVATIPRPPKREAPAPRGTGSGPGPQEGCASAAPGPMSRPMDAAAARYRGRLAVRAPGNIVGNSEYCPKREPACQSTAAIRIVAGEEACQQDRARA